MTKERSKKFESVFVLIPDQGWIEYVTKYSKGTKAVHPVKFEASVVWRSSFSFFAADLRGSFKSEKEAFDHLKEYVNGIGGQITNMSKKAMKDLEESFNYPEGRSNYLRNELNI